VVYASRRTERYRDGYLHDGVNGEPAIVHPDGTFERFCNGKKLENQ
jgi:hypothetical protein